VDLTYNGSSTVPTNAGSYVVVGRINDPVYQGTALGTLVIDKAAATMNFPNLTATYDGTAKPVSVTTTPPGLTVNVTYDGSTTAPTAAGSYAVEAVVDDVNYRRTANRTLVISKASATITGLTGQNKPFDGTTTASASGIAALSGVFGSDEVIVSGTPSFTFASANIATGTPITTSGYTLTGAQAGNYNLILPSLSANITTRELTITGLTGENKTYNASSIASAVGTAILNGVFGTDDVTLSGTPVYNFDSANVGSAVAITTTGYTLSGADSGKYTLAQPSLSANITAKELTITGLTGENKVYDGETSATASGTASLSGAVGDDEVILNGSALSNFVSANVGTGIAITTTGYTLTGTDAGNYTLTQPSLSANITARELSVTGLTGDNKPFNGNTDATASGTASLNGVVGDDEVTLDGAAVLNFVSANVGTGIAITSTGYSLTGANAGNYTLTQPGLSANITAKELTITGLTGEDKPFDGNAIATVSGTAALNGVVGSDEVTLAGTPVFTFASANSGVGIAITTTGYSLGGANAGNYTLTLPSLSATIFEDPLFTNPENVPRIARLPGGGVRLTFKGVLGRTYAIQRSTTLLDGSWTQISTVMADHDTEIIFDDLEAPANSAFYRVSIPAQ
jgi:dienelactone hydrolase